LSDFVEQTFVSRANSVEQTWSSKLSPGGWNYLFALLNNRECSHLGGGRTGELHPWGSKFAPRGQSSPLGVKFHPWGSKFTPRGEVKNDSLQSQPKGRPDRWWSRRQWVPELSQGHAAKWSGARAKANVARVQRIWKSFGKNK
jgi:hypothetical protein